MLEDKTSGKRQEAKGEGQNTARKLSFFCNTVANRVGINSEKVLHKEVMNETRQSI